LFQLTRGDALRSAQRLPLAFIFRAFGAGLPVRQLLRQSRAFGAGLPVRRLLRQSRAFGAARLNPTVEAKHCEVIRTIPQKFSQP